MKNLFITAIVILPLISTGQGLDQYQKKVKGVHSLDKSSSATYATVKLGQIQKAAAYTPLSKASKRNIYNLSEKGQKALIDEMSKKITDGKNLMKTLPTIMEPSGEKEESIEIKTTDFSKKLEINVSNEQILPADQIAQLTVWVTLEDNVDIEFAGFNNFTTKYQSIDFGSLSVNKTTGFTVNAGINIANTGVNSSSSTATTESIDGTDENNNNTAGSNINTERNTSVANTSNIGMAYSYGKTIAQQIAIKNSIIAMKGSMGISEFSILQNGAPNQDLDDNINLDIVFKTVNNISQTFYAFKGLFDDETKKPVTDDSKIDMKTSFYTVPQINSDVKATLTYSFVYRKVKNGGNTARESDDKVNFEFLNKDLVKIPFTFLKQGELKIKVYFIYTDETFKKKLYLVSKSNKAIELIFSDLTSCMEFIEWIKVTKLDKLKDYELQTGTDSNQLQKITPDMLENMSAVKRDIN